MAIDSSKLRLGPCNIYIAEGTSPADVNIGYVDNVQVDITPHMQALMGGQAGTTPIDEVVTGVEVFVVFDAQQIDLLTWRRAMLGVTQSFQGTTTSANHRLEVMPNAGISMRALAKKMTIKPIYGGVETSDNTEVIILPLCAPTAETVTLAFSNTKQEIIKMKYRAFPDPAKRNRMLYFGDDTTDTAAAGTW